MWFEKFRTGKGPEKEWAKDVFKIVGKSATIVDLTNYMLSPSYVYENIESHKNLVFVCTSKTAGSSLMENFLNSFKINKKVSIVIISVPQHDDEMQTQYKKIFKVNDDASRLIHSKTFNNDNTYIKYSKDIDGKTVCKLFRKDNNNFRSYTASHSQCEYDDYFMLYFKKITNGKLISNDKMTDFDMIPKTLKILYDNFLNH